MKKVYMITYSQENKSLSVRGLIKMVEVTTISICISAKKNKRFGVKRKLGIIANFTERHCNYITAFWYVTKSNTEVLLNDSHPDLDLAISPRTSKASKTARPSKWKKTQKKNVLSTTKSKQNQPKHLTKIDVMETEGCHRKH